MDTVLVDSVLLAHSEPRWRVYKNGKDIGIVETHYAYASRFWGEIGKMNGAFYMLRLIQK